MEGGRKRGRECEGSGRAVGQANGHENRSATKVAQVVPKFFPPQIGREKLDTRTDQHQKSPKSCPIVPPADWGGHFEIIQPTPSFAG